MTHLPKNRNNGQTFTVLDGQLTLHNSALNPSEEALWLAASFTPDPYQSVLDAGCGSGIVGFSLLKRCPTLNLTGLDCDEPALAQARQNAELNQLPYTTHLGDFTTAAFTQPFDHVVANLPFHATNRGFTSPNPRKQLAHGLPGHVLEDWLTSLWRHTARQLHVLLHPAEAAIVGTWAAQQNQSYACTFLMTHPHRAPKRVIFHIGQLAQSRIIPTYHPPLRQAVLFEGQKF